MNKKFSTLVAVLLAAGAWTTLDAKVIEVTSPAAGGSYCVGTDADLTDGIYDLLLGVNGQGAATQTITSASPVWTLVGTSAAYSLQVTDAGVTKVFVASTSSGATLSLSDMSSIAGGSAEVKFTLNADGNLVVANKATDFSSNSDINVDDELKVNSSAIATLVTTTNGSDFKFGIYASDVYDKIPGFDLTVNDDGLLNFAATADNAAPSYKAPVYFKTAAGKYLAVEVKDGAYVIKELAKAPTAEEALSASWFWNNGKLYSVAAELADKTAMLSNVAGEYAVVTSAASTFAIANNALTGVVGADVMYASSALAMNQTVSSIGVSESQNIVAGTLDLLNVPSGYCVIALKDGNTVNFLKAGATTTLVGSISASNMTDYKNFLWSVSKQTINGKVAYTFTSLAKDADDKAYVWTVGGEAQLMANAPYSELGITLQNEAGNYIAVDGTTSGNPAVVGLYKSFALAHTRGELDNILDPGFDLTVKYEKDLDKTIENVDVFLQKMYPEGATNATTVSLWNNDKLDQGKDAKKLVLDTKGTVGSDVVGEFKWLTEKEIAKGATGQYLDDFQFQYAQGDPAVITKLVVVGKGNVSILFNEDKYYLTTSTKASAKLPYIKLGGANIYPVKSLLGKLWNISYADSRVNAKADDEEYKLNGILAVTYDKDGEMFVWNKGTKDWDKKGITSVADYVASSTVAESAPEAQWMVTSADLDNNTFTLTNRENPSVQITGAQLRVRDNNKFEVYITPDAGSSNVSTSEKNLKGGNNDIVYVTESAKKDNFQGYMQTTENTLRSNNYFLGQYHAIGGNHNAYFVENHNNSHQIGAVADQSEADKWKLHFAMKANDDTDKYSDVDTVYVITSYATLNKDGNGWENDIKKIKKDTLAILPYTFQKVANREFVYFNDDTKFDFYACDPENKNNSVGNYTKATRFALKVKPSGYNFVEITGTEGDAVLSSNKVYLANSAENGSLEQMQTYAADNNSVMVVEPADASEYHKIAMAWGDTISLYREENNSQVLYEKRDAKSVVEKDTLSFLNIDNINQFSVNPAIFADTAYINRWDADGVLNTTYQYLLTLNPSFGLHTENCEIPGHDPIIGGIDTVYGRFLVNLIDTANVYGVNHIHNNWYINSNEAGEKRAKLSFVEGFHTNDTLYVTRQGGETVKIGMTDPAFNVAKFAFRYVDSDAKTFKIQTQFKDYLGDSNTYETAEEFADAYDQTPGLTSNEGYLKWINGTLVVEKGYENGDVFGITENVKRDPVANEDITTSSISVIASEGKVIINGAAGKKVTISNVLGQTIANTVLSSDNATIFAPAGIVVVAIEGEAAVKAIVK